MNSIGLCTEGLWCYGEGEIVYVRVPSSGGAPVMLHQLPIIIPKIEHINILLVEVNKFIDIEIIESFSIELIEMDKKNIITEIEINDVYVINLIEEKNNINNIEINEHFDVTMQ